MPSWPILGIIDNEPCLPVPLAEVWASCKAGGAIEILSPVEYHTSRQRGWYRGICLKGLSDWTGDTVEHWDHALKIECGGDLLNKEAVYLGKMSNGAPCVVERLTIVGVGKRNMTAFIERVLEKAIEKDWPVTPPDESLRRL
jgi:hypothetical protein